MARWRGHVVAAALRAGWAVLPHLPAPLVHAVAAGAADAVWTAHGAGVRQLEANLRRAAPSTDDAGLRALSRAGMRSYLRYFADVLMMTGWSRPQLQASSRVEGLAPLARALADGHGAVGFLGHLGSWDHIGAWAASELAPVSTVAERLEPPALHDAFVAFRARMGITVVPLTGASSFARLVRTLRGGGFVPLLGDRDLSGTGVRVQLLGEGARAAAGPARLALATGAPLFPITVRYERRLVRWWQHPWGIVTTVHPPVAVPADGPAAAPSGVGARTRAQARDQAVAAMTQACIDAVSAAVRAHPQDWHVLQPVFDADVRP